MKTITDGSAVFVVRDKRMQAMVDMFYPVGTVYMSADKSKTKADFPFMQYGTWEEVPANLCLQTGNASEAGTQRSAGLPNITGSLTVYTSVAGGCGASGAFKMTKLSMAGESYAYSGNSPRYDFNASLSNAIYGSSDTVQPPAYMVRAWIRTA